MHLRRNLGYRAWLGLIALGASVMLAQEGTLAGGALPESDPTIKTWVQPAFPAGVAPSVMDGKATIRMVVDETGAITAARVLNASEPAFGDAALAAAKQWTFSPGVDNGKIAALCIDIPFEFRRGVNKKAGLLPDETLMPQRAPRTPANLKDGPLGEYPPSLVGRGLPGTVNFACHVTADGKATHLRITYASHPDFVLPSFAAFPNWRFSPGSQGDLTVEADLEGQVTYDDVQIPPREKVLEANGIAAPDGSVPDAMPMPVTMADPVYPYDALIKGQSGKASVDFTVAGNGAVSDVHINEATNPEFGAALAAAIETWTFSPAMVHGQGIEVKLRKRAQFEPAAPEAPDWQTRLPGLIRAKAITGGRGLDAPLTPIYRVAPVTPEDATAGEKADAMIEFVVDRDGRARLPRIVSASREAYGWAAATAISQWVFRVPMRGGKPTEVRVQIPMKF